MGNRLGKGVLMEIKLDVRNNKVRGSVMNLEAVETLLVISALRDFSENSEIAFFILNDISSVYKKSIGNRTTKAQLRRLILAD